MSDPSADQNQSDVPQLIASSRQLAGSIRNLQFVRALSLPILADEFRLELLDEASRYPLRAARNTVGKGANQVSQDMLLQDQLRSDGLFARLTKLFQELFDSSVDHRLYFDDRVVFNDMIVQKYEVGSGGITPHLDRTDYRHIICLFVLSGRGRFFIAEDRQKKNQTEISNFPGDVILMPGPGFKILEKRPFHYLEDIAEERWVFGLRHDETKLR